MKWTQGPQEKTESMQNNSACHSHLRVVYWRSLPTKNTR